MPFYTIFLLFLCALASEGVRCELSSDTSYGERLAEGSAYVFNSVTSRDQTKDESNIYSPGVSAILNSDGFLNTMNKFAGSDAKYTPTGPVEAAVHTKKTIEVIPVRFEEPKEGEPQVIEISPYEVPLSIVFKTQTNKINVNQEHKSEEAQEVKETTSEEEPQRVVHNVYRPVVQEVTEIIQPYRKMLQRVEPVIEEMKTIISKAGPPEGNQGQQQSNYASNSFSSNDDNRFSRFGGNDLGRGLSIIPLSYGSASEVIKKLTSAPESSSLTENEISRRFGITNRIRTEDTNDASNSKEDSAPSGKPADYNEIIKDYITKILEPKPSSSKSIKQSVAVPKGNSRSTKLFNVPMNNMPSANKGKDNEKPKFKVIKEFRVTLEDLKKLKLAPFVLPPKNGQSKFGFNSNDQSNSAQRSNSKSHWSNFSTPFSASSFKPMVAHDSKHEPLKRIGDAPMPTHLNRLARNHHRQNSFSRRHLQVDQPVLPRGVQHQLNPMNSSQSRARSGDDRLSKAFQRSAEDQAFFESKRLRA